MPNNQSRSNGDLSRFDNMTNEELEEILRLDAKNKEGEKTDLEILLYVMEVLADRRRDSGTHAKTAEEAFETFKDHYMSPELTDEVITPGIEESVHYSKTNKNKQIRLLPGRIITTAAILAIILCSAITVHAFGIDILEILVNWTQETFQLRSTDSTQISEAVANDDRQFSSLKEALIHKGITVSLVPSWIPDGFTLKDIEIHTSPIQLVFLAIYQDQETTLKIQIKQYIDSDPEQIEQSGSLMEEYESNGILYYIFADNQQLRAAWVNENFECFISGPLDIDTIKRIINSIE